MCSSDLAAVDRGDQIETVHHSLQGVICIWADDRQLACLSDRGDLDLVAYKAKSLTVKSVNDLKQEFFRADKQFEAANHEAVSITGCAQYLAVAKSCISECTNTVALLNRNGKLLSTSNDNGYSKPLPRKTPIHNMQFIIVKHRIYLVTQNLFSFVSLYLINPKSKAAIHYIRSVIIALEEINWPLIPIPSQPGHLITSNYQNSCRLMQIYLNYEKDADC